MARSFTPELGIRIRFSDHKADWWGTRAQLEAEGFIPQGTQWPVGRKYTKIKTQTAWFCINRVGGDTTESNEQTIYRIDHYSQTGNSQDRQIAKKLKEARDIAAIGNADWYDALRKHTAARRDQAFQTFKHALLGEKKRGRPAKTSQTTQTQGANHV